MSGLQSLFLKSVETSKITRHLLTVLSNDAPLKPLVAYFRVFPDQIINLWLTNDSQSGKEQVKVTAWH